MSDLRSDLLQVCSIILQIIVFKCKCFTVYFWLQCNIIISWNFCLVSWPFSVDINVDCGLIIFLCSFLQRVLPVKLAAARTLCVFIRYNRRYEQRQELCCRLIQGWSAVKRPHDVNLQWHIVLWSDYTLFGWLLHIYTFELTFSC